MEVLKPDDIIFVDSIWFESHNTYVVEEFITKLRPQIRTANHSRCDEDWITWQTNGRVLHPGDPRGWRSGKLKVRIAVTFEFEPELEPESNPDAVGLEENSYAPAPELTTELSPLDALRMEQNNG
jgi:hypothetical protein